MTEANKNVYLMDASAFIHRSFHALPNMSTRAGQPTGAAFGFTNTLLRLLRDSRPAYLGVVFDSRGPTRRHELYPAYKANRPAMDPNLAAQQAPIREIVGALGLRGLEEPGFEADDIIASMCRLAVSEERKVVIVSGDKDFYQLLSPMVSMYDPDPKKSSAMTLEGFRDRFHIEPAAFLDVQALMGDTSDNIPGVPNVGQVTALKLIGSFGSLDEVYRNLGKITQPKLRANLAANEESARLSLQLARLGKGLPPMAAIEDLRPQGPDMEGLQRVLSGLEFHKFLSEIRSHGIPWLEGAQSGPTLGTGAARPMVTRLFGPGSARYLEEHPGEGHSGPETVLVDGPEGWDRLLVAMGEAREGRRPIGLAPETSAESGILAGLALSTHPTLGFYVPLGHQGHENQDPAEAALRLSPFIAGGQPVKVVHDVKAFLRQAPGMALEPPPQADGGQEPFEDPMLAAYLLNPDDRNDLASLAIRHLGREPISLAQLLPGTKKPALAASPPALVAKYTACKAAAGLELWPVLAGKLSEEKALEILYRELELPLAGLLARIEATGVLVDPVALGELSAELGKTMGERAEAIFAKAGKHFNLASPKQLSDVLFLDLKLPTGKKTAAKTSFSTDNEVLTELALLYPIASEILAWREVSKLKNTYADKLPLAINQATGRIHTSFNQALTATGRLSSSEPNLQNIPAKSEEGRRIRAAFMAKPGWRLLSADYSQIELRVIAHFSGDKALIQAFEDDEDIHAQTASEIFGTQPGKVPPDLRRQAKTINFGIIYGQGPFGLAKQLGVPQSVAKDFIDRYFRRFPGVKAYMDRTLAAAVKAGFVSTWYGRRRYLPGLSSAGAGRRESERMAINTPIQGTAADIIKMAMLKVDRRLRREGLESRIIIQVHDELVLEVPEAELAAASALVAEEMAAVGRQPILSGAEPLKVALKVDVADGLAWVHA
ncbi:MAG: DNA polymerase I [Deltaproteobacteria bacterium]|nr:DNA polymerase I [Deltaproteobacteria bacterium]